MMTNKDCEISNYVMWSVLINARQKTTKQMEDNKKTSLGNIGTLQKNAQIKTLQNMKHDSSGGLGLSFSFGIGSKGCTEEECKKIGERVAQLEAMLKK